LSFARIYWSVHTQHSTSFSMWICMRSVKSALHNCTLSFTLYSPMHVNNTRTCTYTRSVIIRRATMGPSKTRSLRRAFKS
jgi:hypothetical protein